MNSSIYHTESDVEQKFILPLLINQYPIGLGYNNVDFRTKFDLRKIEIDKGSKSKIYFPDYLIIMDGLPLLVIEAKKPGENLDEAYREARLYASEINSNYKTNLNPCSQVIATDGNITIFGSWDSQNYEGRFISDTMDISNPDFYKFLEFCKKDFLLDSVKALKKKIRKETRFSKPVHMLGGKGVVNSSMGENSFGSNLSIEYKYLFNPETFEEKKKVVENAYVASKRKLSHVNPIDKIIRGSISFVDDFAIKIENTADPKEVINSISQSKKMKNEVLLLIGSVGSGKSTFVHYLREVALPKDLKSKIFWLSLNMNDAPGRDLIYNWILENAIEQIQKLRPDLDIDDFEVQQKIFSRDIIAFKKGPIRMYGEDSDKFKEEFYAKMVQLLSDKNKHFKELLEYFFISRNQAVIIVLDNVDKRDRDTQLLMFEVANWLKSSFNCTVFLPLREETYENFRNTPPLDTVINDFVFKIDPPLLEQVIYKRFDYAMREVNGDNSSFYYFLKNGTKVKCARKEVVNYISSILKVLFQDQFFKRLIIGLADKDIRRGLAIFLNFCKSGHIPEEEIFKMRFSNEEYKFPSYLVTRILLRGNRKFYSDEAANVKNLFHSYIEDAIPDPYIRLSILNWLKDNYRLHGPNKTKGYHKIESLVSDLIDIGHSESRIISEIEYLIENHCIISETQNSDVRLENLISITSSGFVHLDLLSNIDYLSTVAEDTFFRNLQMADIIKENIAGRDMTLRFSKENTLENSSTLINYLVDYKDYFPYKPELFLERGKWKEYSDLSYIKTFLDQKVAQTIGVDESLALKQYPVGTQSTGQIVSLQPYGLFIEFGLNATGFIHVSEFKDKNNPLYLEENFEVGV